MGSGAELLMLSKLSIKEIHELHSPKRFNKFLKLTRGAADGTSENFSNQLDCKQPQR
jgi:hypothetical protein